MRTSDEEEAAPAREREQRVGGALLPAGGRPRLAGRRLSSKVQAKSSLPASPKYAKALCDGILWTKNL